MVIDRSRSFSIVTGTRPLSPEKVIVPSDSTRTCAMSASSSSAVVLTSARPPGRSVRHAADSARSSAAEYGSLTPVGSSRIDVNEPRRAVSRAIACM